MSDPKAFVTSLDAWLRTQALQDLAPKDEVRALLDEVRQDDALWARQRPRYDELWAKGEARLRGEGRSPRQLLTERAVERLLSAVERAEPDPEAVRTFLRSPAIEAMLGSILYTGIFEFIKRVDLIGNLVNKLPIIGGIRRKVMSAFKDEIDNRLEGQIKGFLGGFSGMAVDRMIDFVLSDENREGFRKARRRLAEHLLDRPLKELIPQPEATTRLRDDLWTALREASLKEEGSHLDRFYADHGSEPWDRWSIELSPRGRDLLATALSRFLEGAGWSLSGPPAS